MYKSRILLFVSISLFFSTLTFSQNNTNSPYTRFGLGSISDNSNSSRRALSGTSIGFRSSKEINTVNPASYSAVDTLTFMFDVGLSAMYSHFSDENGKTGKRNGNLEYITMQFPVMQFLGVSAGILPYSFSGYSFSESSKKQIDPADPTDTLWTTNAYSGTGTISQVYLGVAGKFLNHFSVGINGYYMFGNLNNLRTSTFQASSSYNSTGQENKISVSAFRFRYGFQYFNTINKKHEITVGIYYENKLKMQGVSASTINTSQIIDTLAKNNNFDLPQTFGIGGYYTFNQRLSAGVDFSFQQWANARFFGKTDSLANRWKFSAGAEYVPNPNGYRYSDHLRYRAGVSLSNSYYDVNGMTMPLNIGVSIGLGIPMPKSNSTLNATFEYGKIGNSNVMSENYFKLTISGTINEFWFFKRKL